MTPHDKGMKSHRKARGAGHTVGVGVGVLTGGFVEGVGVLVVGAGVWVEGLAGVVLAAGALLVAAGVVDGFTVVGGTVVVGCEPHK